MTTLVFNSGRFTIATDQWTVTEYHSHAVATKSAIEIHAAAKMFGPTQIDISMAEFLGLVADAGKVLDLRKLQEEKR